MTILWCGGEDIDFPNGGTSVGVTTNGGYYDSTYARCSIQSSLSGKGGFSRSAPFSGGAVTSAWFHFLTYTTSGFLNSADPFFGLSLSSAANNGAGLYLATYNGNQLALYTYDGTSWTMLAHETGSSLGTYSLFQVDMHLTSYGASATVDVYLNKALLFSFSGNVAVTGVTDLDCVSLPSGSNRPFMSEVIVADSDTRSMRLATLAPNAAGDSLGSWTGLYSQINATTINDTNPVYVNATASDAQFNLTDCPSGTFTVAGVKAAMRAEVTAGSTPTGIKLGVKTNATVNVDAGHTLTNAFTTYERLMAQNPVTVANWTTSDLTALQIDFQSE